eukprot:15475261-Alexandrium_andersonii.AAC.1
MLNSSGSLRAKRRASDKAALPDLFAGTEGPSVWTFSGLHGGPAPFSVACSGVSTAVHDALSAGVACLNCLKQLQ